LTINLGPLLLLGGTILKKNTKTKNEIRKRMKREKKLIITNKKKVRGEKEK